MNEGLEQLNYANDRLGAGIKNASKMAKSGLAKYASTDRINGNAIEDDHYRNLLESSGFGTLAKGVGIQLKANARRGINSIKHTSFDDVKSALGSGASRFQEAMSRTAVKSKEFGRNAAMTAAIFGGALDPRSNASQTVQSRFEAASIPDKTLPQRYESPVARGWKNMGFIERANMHSDVLDLARRLRKNKYETLSKTGSRILGNRSINAENSILPSYGKNVHDAGRTNLGTYSPSAAIRLAGSGISPINQKPTAPRWKGNDQTSLETRKRFAQGDLADLDSRYRYNQRGSIATGSATKPYKDWNKHSPAYWQEAQEEHMDYRDRVKPSRFTRDRLASKIGNMTTEKFNKELEKRGISFAMINQTPVPMIPKAQNNASIRELEKRLGLI